MSVENTQNTTEFNENGIPIAPVVVGEELNPVVPPTNTPSAAAAQIPNIASNNILHAAPLREICRPLPAAWYFLTLLPGIGVLFVLIGCFQKRYRFVYQLPAAMIGMLTLLLPLFFINLRQAKQEPLVVQGTPVVELYNDWKNLMSRRAETGVVIVHCRGRRDEGFGTGVVVAKKDNAALILTNRHVVIDESSDRPRAVSVQTSDKRKLKARIVALPRKKDVDMALLLVEDGDTLEVMGTIADYNSLKTGDEVVAIGHPNGYNFSIIQGIVSGLREDMLIQSSASINPGNSGGPLLDYRGRVIGVNTYFIRNTQGLNFAFRADFIMQRKEWKYSRKIDDLLDAVVIEK